MKYGIEGIEKGRVIHSIKPAGQTIFINYLDGTQDVIENTKENLDKIITVMDEQAVKYLKNKKVRTRLYKFLQGCAVVGGIVVCFLTKGAIGKEPLLNLETVIAFTAIVSSTSVFTSLQRRMHDMKKYDIYMTKTKSKIEEYISILEKENKIVNIKNQETPILEDITDLDHTSIRNLKYINNKVERRQEIEGKSPKVKSFNQEKSL